MYLRWEAATIVDGRAVWLSQCGLYRVVRHVWSWRPDRPDYTPQRVASDGRGRTWLVALGAEGSLKAARDRCASHAALYGRVGQQVACLA